MNKISQKQKMIPVSGPWITKAEVEYVAKAAEEAWYTNANKYVREFEEKFAKYLGVKYALATNSCTAALHLGLLTLGVGSGDEVLVPDVTWISTAAVVSYLNAKPVFVDIEKDTWCIDPVDLERKITKRTKAIIPVHLYGHPAAMPEIRSLARKHKLFIIEDAAEAIGAKIDGKLVGVLGDCAGFSFHGSKMLVTGEGGMFVTNSKKLYDRAKYYSSDGRDAKKLFWNTAVAFHYKMSDVQAALGIVQLSRIDELIEKKEQMFSWYKKKLGSISGVTLNTQRGGYKNIYWMVTAILDKSYRIKKEKLIELLKVHSIASRPFFYPLSSLPPYKSVSQNSVAYAISQYGVNLPSALNLTERDVEYICSVLRRILNKT